MIKKLIILFITLIIFSCNTTKNETLNIINEKATETKTEESENSELIREALSNNILASSDQYYADFASLVLDLIRRKQWEILTNFTDKYYYNDYVLDGKGSLVDYSTFILHTGDKGISPNYPISSLKNAFYTNSYYNSNNNIVYEGLYLYEKDETEYFKVVIIDTVDGLIITRE